VNQSEILKNNLKIINNIKRKIFYNEELSGDEKLYFSILKLNKLMDENGKVTERGKEELYH
jgi:hypothetical protein